MSKTYDIETIGNIYVILMTNATGGVTLNETFLKLFLDPGKAGRYAQERANAIPKDLPDRIELVECDAETGDVVARHVVERKEPDTKKRDLAEFIDRLMKNKDLRHYEVLSAGSDTVLGLVVAGCPYEAHKQAVAFNKGRPTRIRRVGHVAPRPYNYVVYWSPKGTIDSKPTLITTDKQEADEMASLLAQHDPNITSHVLDWLL